MIYNIFFFDGSSGMPLVYLTILMSAGGSTIESTSQVGSKSGVSTPDCTSVVSLQ